MALEILKVLFIDALFQILEQINDVTLNQKLF